MPLPELTKKITLDKVGAPEFWVEFRRIPAMTYQELMDFNAFGRATIPDEERVMKRFSMLILGWNIPDRETGDVLPLPSEEKETVLKLPAIFSDHIATAIFADSEEGGISHLPLASESETSSQSSSSPQVEEVVPPKDE